MSFSDSFPPITPSATTGVPSFFSLLSCYLELTKPRLTLLALAMTGVGFHFASWGSLDLILLFHTLLGSCCVGGGANALNQFLEKDVDSKMTRTQNRPLPSGRLSENQALLFGIFLSVTGVLYLSLFVNLLASLLGTVTLLTYLFCYTPLKRKTALCTIVGAIPGAIPPLIGWAAVRENLSLQAWVLFSILFLWQFPHFLAIAWFCRQDYTKAGLSILTVVDSQGKSTPRQILLYCLALLPVSLLPSVTGMTGAIYFLSALLLGFLFLGFGARLMFSLQENKAKQFFLFSILYLFLLIVIMISDKI